ncbi:hypothetical protein AB0M43_36320 [Longispora sp. NPDC051575]|uniref:hypothetical protein n=1 Tax=Longispora sp. NPDC051575 TaxID=3154943 RepID=UPI00343E3D68
MGRILATYGAISVAGSLAWGIGVDKVKPDRNGVIGAKICLVCVGCDHGGSSSRVTGRWGRVA